MSLSQATIKLAIFAILAFPLIFAALVIRRIGRRSRDRF